MPGFMIHLAESQLILPNLHYDEKQKNEFLLGALLPDTMPTEQKRGSHFWPRQIWDHMCRAPKVDAFLEKYGHRLNEPMMMGYLAHLCLDADFVDEYWKELLSFYDEKKEPTIYNARTKHVYLKQRDLWIPKDIFFSDDCYYGDYSRMNEYIRVKYDVQIPTYRDLSDFHMDEVEIDALADVIDMLKSLVETSKVRKDEELTVFTYEGIDALIKNSAIKFSKQFIKDEI